MLIGSEGITHLIISSGIYELYFTNPEKYHKEVEYYQQIFQLPLVAEFVPGKTLQGASYSHLFGLRARTG